MNLTLDSNQNSLHEALVQTVPCFWDKMDTSLNEASSSASLSQRQSPKSEFQITFPSHPCESWNVKALAVIFRFRRFVRLRPLSGQDRSGFYTICTLEKMLGFAISLVDPNITNADMSNAAVNANLVSAC